MHHGDVPIFSSKAATLADAFFGLAALSTASGTTFAFAANSSSSSYSQITKLHVPSQVRQRRPLSVWED